MRINSSRRAVSNIKGSSPALAALTSLLFFAILGHPAQAIEHIRVTWFENPQSEAVVSWTSRTPEKKFTLHWDTSSQQGKISNYPNQETPFQSGQFTMTSKDEGKVKPGFFHHVHLTELTPATAYHFIVSDGENHSKKFHFFTAPANDQPIKLIFGGDSRIGGSEPYEHTDRQKMNDRIRALFERNPEVVAFLHGGDYCQRAEWRYLDPWLTDHDRVHARSGRLLPIIPLRGNHDTQIGFEEMFPSPGLDRSYYFTSQLSSEVAIICLNTEISTGGDQKKWLEKMAPETRQNHRWALAAYHRPAYPSVRNYQDGASRRKNFIPALENNFFDLICESHDHALKRTVPIFQGKPNPERGIVFIGDGGLGVPQRKPDPSRWYFDDRKAVATATHHVHIIEFSADEMAVRAYNMRGRTVDKFDISSKQKMAK